MKALVERIVSGGQTGADRAALDWAIAHGIPHGGWCPKDRMAEDGRIDQRYQLQETPTNRYPQRTEWNVRDSDGTVVFSIKAVLTGGSKKTVELARKHHKPLLHVWRDGGPQSPEGELVDFIRQHQIKVLNVAGPRASPDPEIAAFVAAVLEKAWTAINAALPPALAITTDRLALRPLVATDASAVARLAGRREIATTTISIPHPYSEQQAREWISAHTGGSSGKEIAFAITLKTDETLIGGIGLGGIDSDHSQAEMGFWIGVDFWRKGYATEAAGAVLRYGFENLGLNRIRAHHMVRNPASGRVLEKIGMQREGLLRQHIRKWGVFEDVVIYAILRTEWQSSGDARKAVATS